MAETIHACMSCGNEVSDPSQRTCPHCLTTLRLRTFGSREAFAGFQADRRQHGAYVDPVRRPPRRGYAMALWFFAGVMLVAAGGIVLAGFQRGAGVGLVATFTAAIIPLGLGVALVEVARRVGGGTP